MSRESIIYFILNLFLFFICNSTHIIAECCKSCCNSSTDAYEEERIKNTSEAFYNCKTRYDKEIDARFNEIKENNAKEDYKNELIDINEEVEQEENLKDQFGEINIKKEEKEESNTNFDIKRREYNNNVNIIVQEEVGENENNYYKTKEYKKNEKSINENLYNIFYYSNHTEDNDKGIVEYENAVEFLKFIVNFKNSKSMEGDIASKRVVIEKGKTSIINNNIELATGNEIKKNINKDEAEVKGNEIGKNKNDNDDNFVEYLTNVLDLYGEYFKTIENVAKYLLNTNILNALSFVSACVSLFEIDSINKNTNEIKLKYNKPFFDNFIKITITDFLSIIRLLNDKNIVFKLNINNDATSIWDYIKAILSEKYLKIFNNEINIDKLDQLKENRSYIKISHCILEKILNDDINKIDESNNVNNLDFNCEIFEKNDRLDIEKNKNTVKEDNENNKKKAEEHENEGIFNNTVNLTLYDVISLFEIILYSCGQSVANRNIYFNNGSFFIFCDIEGVIKKYIDDLTPENIFSIDDKSTIMNSTKLFLDIKSINLLKKIIKHNREPHDCELYENLENKCEEFKNILNYKIDNINIDKYEKIKHIFKLYEKLKEEEKKLPDNKDEKFGSVNNEQINGNKEDNKEKKKKLPDNKEENSGSVNIKQTNTKEKHIKIDNKSKVEDITLIECVNIINNFKKDVKLKQSLIQKIIDSNEKIETENNESSNDIENKDENINKKKELANKSVIELLKIKEDNESNKKTFWNKIKEFTFLNKIFS